MTEVTSAFKQEIWRALRKMQLEGQETRQEIAALKSENSALKQQVSDLKDIVEATQTQSKGTMTNRELQDLTQKFKVYHAEMMSTQRLTLQRFFQSLTDGKQNKSRKKRRIDEDESSLPKRPRRKCTKAQLVNVVKNPITDSSTDGEANISDNDEDPLWAPTLLNGKDGSATRLQHSAQSSGCIQTAESHRGDEGKESCMDDRDIPLEAVGVDGLEPCDEGKESCMDDRDIPLEAIGVDGLEPCVDLIMEAFVDDEEELGEDDRKPTSLAERLAGVDDSDIRVDSGFSGLSKDDCKTKKDKLHYCVFCQQPQMKLLRHFIAKHRHEPAVKVLLNTRDKRVKKNELAKLRNSGDHLHNVKVVQEGAGTLVVKRRKTTAQSETKDLSLGNFKSCPRCLGYFSRADLWRHRCPAVEENVKDKRLSCQEELQPISHKASFEEDAKLLKIMYAMRPL